MAVDGYADDFELYDDDFEKDDDEDQRYGHSHGRGSRSAVAPATANAAVGGAGAGSGRSASRLDVYYERLRTGVVRTGVTQAPAGRFDASCQSEPSTVVSVSAQVPDDLAQTSSASSQAAAATLSSLDARAVRFLQQAGAAIERLCEARVAARDAVPSLGSVRRPLTRSPRVRQLHTGGDADFLLAGRAVLCGGASSGRVGGEIAVALGPQAEAAAGKAPAGITIDSRIRAACLIIVMAAGEGAAGPAAAAGAAGAGEVLRFVLLCWSQPTCLAFAPDGSTLFAGTIDGSVHAWDLTEPAWMHSSVFGAKLAAAADLAPIAGDGHPSGPASGNAGAASSGGSTPLTLRCGLRPPSYSTHAAAGADEYASYGDAGSRASSAAGRRPGAAAGGANGQGTAAGPIGPAAVRSLVLLQRPAPTLMSTGRRAAADAALLQAGSHAASAGIDAVVAKAARAGAAAAAGSPGSAGSGQANTEPDADAAAADAADGDDAGVLGGAGGGSGPSAAGRRGLSAPGAGLASLLGSVAARNANSSAAAAAASASVAGAGTGGAAGASAPPLQLLVVDDTGRCESWVLLRVAPPMAAADAVGSSSGSASARAAADDDDDLGLHGPSPESGTATAAAASGGKSTSAGAGAGAGTLRALIDHSDYGRAVTSGVKLVRVSATPPPPAEHSRRLGSGNASAHDAAAGAGSNGGSSIGSSRGEGGAGRMLVFAADACPADPSRVLLAASDGTLRHVSRTATAAAGAAASGAGGSADSALVPAALLPPASAASFGRLADGSSTPAAASVSSSSAVDALDCFAFGLGLEFAFGEAPAAPDAAASGLGGPGRSGGPPGAAGSRAGAGAPLAFLPSAPSATSVAFHPLPRLSHFALAGYESGAVALFTTGHAMPLRVWNAPWAASASASAAPGVSAAAGAGAGAGASPVVRVAWLPSRPCAFIAVDEGGAVALWDVAASAAAPVHVQQLSASWGGAAAAARAGGSGAGSAGAAGAAGASPRVVGAELIGGTHLAPRSLAVAVTFDSGATALLPLDRSFLITRRGEAAAAGELLRRLR